MSTKTKSTSPTVTRAGIGAAATGLAGVIATVVAAIAGHGSPVADAITGLASGGVSIAGLIGTVLHHNKALEHDAEVIVHDAGPKVVSAIRTVDQIATADIPGLAAAQSRLETELRSRLGVVEATVASAVSKATGTTVTGPELDAKVEAAVRRIFATVSADTTTAAVAAPGTPVNPPPPPPKTPSA